MTRARAAVAVVAAVTLAATPAFAGGSALSGRVAVPPLTTLGSETTAASAREMRGRLVEALASVEGVDVVPQDRVDEVLHDRPRLRACEGQPACLARLARAAEARYTVQGEVGGLGQARVVYLEIVDAKPRGGRRVRSTTLELGTAGDPAREARAAATRLVAPERHAGTLAIRCDTPGATVYVDGELLGRTPLEPARVEVGTHALRITHPEYRDFVKFVDVAFEDRGEVKVPLQQYPIVAAGGPASGLGAPRLARSGGPDRENTPWYRRWYTVAGFGAAILTGTALAVAAATAGIDADREKTVTPP